MVSMGIARTGGMVCLGIRGGRGAAAAAAAAILRELISGSDEISGGPRSSTKSGGLNAEVKEQEQAARGMF